MTILHVNEHLAPKGGVETYLLALLPMLRDQGVSAHLAYGMGDPSLWSPSHEIREIGAASSSEDGRAYRRTKDLIAEVQPDIVHLHNVQNLGVVRAGLDAAPVVMTSHDFRSVCPANTFYFRRTGKVCERDRAGLPCFAAAVTKRCLTPRPSYARYYYRRAASWTAQSERFARVIAPSEGARSRLLRAGFARERVVVAPYFCPVEPAESPRPLPSRATITFIGRITRNKGYSTFVEALGELPEQVRGVMVGNFGEGAEATVLALAERSGCAGRLELRPWAGREEVVRTLDETSVFVFPSLWPETLGIVGLEALSRGVPVVASDVGGVREWLREGHTGHLVPPGDPGAIAGALRGLLEQDEKLAEMGRNGIALIRNKFAPMAHAESLVSLYREASGAQIESSTMADSQSGA